jgi:hypothetical protein
MRLGLLFPLCSFEKENVKTKKERFCGNTVRILWTLCKSLIIRSGAGPEPRSHGCGLQDVPQHT